MLEIVEKLCSDVGIIVRGRLVHQAVMDEVRQSGTLEERFITAVGGDQVELQRLSWLQE